MVVSIVMVGTCQPWVTRWCTAKCIYVCTCNRQFANVCAVCARIRVQDTIVCIYIYIYIYAWIRVRSDETYVLTHARSRGDVPLTFH